jgi:aldose 1-epimerase
MVGYQRSADVDTSAGVYQIDAGPLHARVQPADGGRIAEFWLEDVGGKRTDILVPLTAADYVPTAWPKAGCYPLVPYSNRIRNAHFVAEGRSVSLAPHPGEEPHALHGFAQLRPWDIEVLAADLLAMTYRHRPDAWPWPFTARQLVSLDEQGLSVEFSVTHHGASAMPVGFGLHPYFAAGPGDRVNFEVGGEWSIDAANIAVDWSALPAGETVHILEEQSVARYLTGWKGRAVLARRNGPTVTITADSLLDHFVFFVPAGGPYACIEPVSHVADAFNLAAKGADHTGHRTLAPGETLSASIRIGVT